MVRKSYVGKTTVIDYPYNISREYISFKYYYTNNGYNGVLGNEVYYYKIQQGWLLLI